MLRIHFLNVGHGDCTIIEHPSNRLTMIDCNTSGEFDSESLEEFMKEWRSRNALAGAGILGNQSFGASLLATAGTNPLSRGLASPTTGLLGGLAEYAAAQDALKRELTDPVEYMLEHYPGRRLWRFVLTHPDLDHMRGLKRIKEVVGIDNFWDVAHTKETPNFRNGRDREDWDYYIKLRKGGEGTRIHHFHRGDTLFAFAKDENGALGGDNIEILSPTPDLITATNMAEQSNDLSYVLRVSGHGNSVLLPGDAEDAAWEQMIGFYGPKLKSDVLKASHHGRDTGFHLEAMKLIDPRVTIVSVGRKPETTDAHSKYHYHCGNVKSTRYHGNIQLEVDDAGQRHWYVDHNPDA